MSSVSRWVSCLVRGFEVVVERVDGVERLVDVPGRSWLEVRGDFGGLGVMGRPFEDDRGLDALSDLVVFESCVMRIRKPEVRAALVLRAWGFSDGEVGGLLDRRVTGGRSGSMLVDEGVGVVRSMVRKGRSGFWRVRG